MSSKEITSYINAIDKANDEAYALVEKKHEKAREILLKALKDAKKASYDFGYAKAMQHLAWLKINLFDLPEALEAVNEAQDIFTELDEKLEVGICWNYQAWIYYYLDDQERRLQCNLNYVDSIDAKEESRLYYSALNNLGDNYVKLGQFDKALDTFKACLKEPSLENMELGPLYNNLGEAYLAKGDYEVAEEWFLKAIACLTQVNYSRFLSYSRLYLAELYLKSGQKDKVPALLTQAQETSELHSQKRLLAIIHKLFGEYYEIEHKPKESLAHFKLYMSYTEEYKSEAHSARINSVIFTRQLQQVKKESEIEQKKNEELLVANATIRKQAEALEKANAQLKNFAYNASHDLKEPLRTMSTFSKLLKDRAGDRLKEEEKDFLNFISNSAKRMDSMVNDLLDYATISKKLVTNDSVDLNTVMQNIESDISVLLTEVKGKLEYDTLPSIISNHTLVTQLFQNLISNAIKFRKTELTPLVQIRYEETEMAHVISVKDNGIGIKESNLEKIFDIFTRLHSSADYSGSGIGLATCKQITEELGGKLEVSSVFGAGSCFKVSLPK